MIPREKEDEDDHLVKLLMNLSILSAFLLLAIKKFSRSVLYNTKLSSLKG